MYVKLHLKSSLAGKTVWAARLYQAILADDRYTPSPIPKVDMSQINIRSPSTTHATSNTGVCSVASGIDT